MAIYIIKLLIQQAADFGEKNRRNNGDGTRGVDLNRNYAFQWGFDDFGSSGFTGSNVYRGTAPASEPEIALMQDFAVAK